MHQLIPAVTLLEYPVPPAFNDLIAIKLASGATPLYVPSVLAIIPATCEP